MKFTEREFIPVLVGGDVNNYCVARSYYEAFKVKSVLVGKYPIYPTIYTDLFDAIYDVKIENPDVLISILDQIDKKYPDKKKIILGNNDNYVRLIIETKNRLSSNFIAPYIDLELFDRLIIKEHFYDMCEKYGLDYPATYIYKCSEDIDYNIELPFDFPVAVKASDTVVYSKYKFEGKRKGYVAHNKEELDHILKIVCESGYDDSLIIQDFIPGDDSNMRIITCYCDKNAKVKGIAMGHVLLEDHAPMAVGNYTAIMGEYNEEIANRVVEFLEKIEFVGICHFDIKYDSRDNKYKFFEINIRQGRFNYYTTACGLNLTECLVDDYINNKEMELKIAKDKAICSLVPKYVIRKYVKDKELLLSVKELIKQKRWIRPLLMKDDANLKRVMYHFRTDIVSIVKYKKYYK